MLFIDRDGTIIEEPADFQVDALSKIRFRPDVIPCLLSLTQAGYRFIMVSNQDGLGTENFPQDSFNTCQDFLLAALASQGIYFQEIFICPHRQEENCHCRKPKTGLLDSFLRLNPCEPNLSWVIGDRETDKELADNLDLPFLPVNNDHGWKEIAHAILNQPRQTKLFRQTKETTISIQLNLDGEEPIAIETPIGFFNHLLEQIAKHAGISLVLQATADLEVDDHHLIEDCAIALGVALRQALADKLGIARFGFCLPMDESLAKVFLDLDGRGYCAFEAKFTREFVGGMATEMVSHFFKSLAMALKASLHIQVSGENHHHMIEACFKALGRVLRQAIQRLNQTLPSTKGVL